MIFSCFRYEFVCDDCHTVAHFDGKASARAFGWSVSHSRFEAMNTGMSLNGFRCWCPNCSANHRRGRPRKTSH